MILQIIRSFLALITISIFSLVLFIRSYREFKRTKELNYTRILITHSIFMKIVDHTIRLCNYLFQMNLFGWSYSEVIDDITTTTFFTGLMIMLGLCFAAYINEWDTLLYMPVFFYVEALILYEFTQFAEPIHVFIVGGGIMTVCAVWEVGIRTKDLVIIRVAIIYTIIFINSLGSAITQVITGLIGYPIGILIILIYFNPFQEMKREDQTEKVVIPLKQTEKKGDNPP